MGMKAAVAVVAALASVGSAPATAAPVYGSYRFTGTIQSIKVSTPIEGNGQHYPTYIAPGIWEIGQQFSIEFPVTNPFGGLIYDGEGGYFTDFGFTIRSPGLVAYFNRERVYRRMPGPNGYRVSVGGGIDPSGNFDMGFDLSSGAFDPYPVIACEPEPGALVMVPDGECHNIYVRMWSGPIGTSIGQMDFSIVGYNDNRGIEMHVGDISAMPIPEPRTWAMMICGFALVGATVRRRRLLPSTLH